MRAAVCRRRRVLANGRREPPPSGRLLRGIAATPSRDAALSHSRERCPQRWRVLGGCPVRRGSLTCRWSLGRWSHIGGWCQLGVELVVSFGEVGFDVDRELREAAVALDFAEAGLGFEHSGGGPA